MLPNLYETESTANLQKVGFDGQTVGRDHILQEKDIVELHV